MDDEIFDVRALQPQFNMAFGNRAGNVIEMVRLRRILRQIANDDPHLGEEDFNEPREPTPHHSRIIYTVYLFYVLPLPIINFPVLWRRFRQHSVFYWIDLASAWAFRQFVRLGWLVWYLAITMWWLEDLCKFISVFGSMATYSPGYFGDIFTYAVRNWPFLLERKYELFKTWGNETPIIELDSFLQVITDNLSSHVRAICLSETGLEACVLDTNSLIFRFSGVLERIFPMFSRLPTFFLTCTTISIYIAYGIVAQFFGANVLIFLCVHTAHRWLPSVKFTSRLFKLVWNHSEGLVW